MAKSNKSKASCCVPGCKTTGYIVENSQPVTFHGLPLQDKDRLREWIVRIKRDVGPQFKVTKHTKICSRHFLPGDFRVTPKGRRFIKENKHPSIFDLRLGLLVKDIAKRFHISQSAVHKYYDSWINYMYLRLGSLNIWPPKEEINRTMPETMRQKFATLEWIIDAFEIQIQRPSSLMLQSQSYSSYKSRNTVKGLVACTPSGQIGFVSQLYTGNISDRELVIRSGFLDMPHRKGAVWLVDKGFQIQDLADKLGVIVNMPAFVGTKGHLTAKEVFHTQ